MKLTLVFFVLALVLYADAKKSSKVALDSDQLGFFRSDDKRKFQLEEIEKRRRNELLRGNRVPAFGQRQRNRLTLNNKENKDFSKIFRTKFIPR